MMIKTYSELVRHDTFLDRFNYLSLRGHIGRETFGFDRWINQAFYKSREWKQARQYVIARDLGCDLGVDGYDIHSQLLVHHMNPLSPSDIDDASLDILDPNFLITTTHRTHNAIHYGDSTLLTQPFEPRTRGDTALW
jgi:hypothetical protein